MVEAGLEIAGTVSGCMNWVDEGAPPGALEACEHCVDCVSWASPSASPGPCPAFLSVFPVGGRWWVTYFKGPGE